MITAELVDKDMLQGQMDVIYTGGFRDGKLIIIPTKSREASVVLKAIDF